MAQATKAGTVQITGRQLAALGACSSQRTIFRETFGAAAEVNEENADKAVAAGLDIHWLAISVLKGTHLAEYQRVTQAAGAEYQRVRQPAEAEYERVRQAAWAEYERVSARAFVVAFLAQQAEG